MKKNIYKYLIFIVIALSPLLYYQYRQYVPGYSRRPLVYEMLFLGPYIFYFITAFLGIKLNQTRIFYTSILWFSLYYLINTTDLPVIEFEYNVIQLVKLLSIISFIIVILLYVFTEKYILGLYGLVRFLFVAIPIFLSIYLAGEIAQGTYPYLMERPLLNLDFWFLPEKRITTYF